MAESAAAATFVNRSLTVGFVSPSRRRATSRSRSSSERVMSTETVSWKTGACQASVSRRAIVLRIDVSSISSTSPAGAATAAGAALGAATAPRSTSSATIRPSGPLPESVAMSIPFSARACARAAKP